MVEFVSYDGSYPCLCMGTLVLAIDGENVTFPEYCLRSGGSVWFNEEWDEHVECGAWSVEVPEQYAHLRDAIEECVNANVPHGCCGGCV